MEKAMESHGILKSSKRTNPVTWEIFPNIKDRKESKEENEKESFNVLSKKSKPQNHNNIFKNVYFSGRSLEKVLGPIYKKNVENIGL